MQKKIAIFNGSPRRNGTSFSFAHTIEKLARNHGHSADIFHILDSFQAGDIKGVRAAVSSSDVIVLVSPLYVDALPYIDIWFLEKLAKDLPAELRGKDFVAVGQSGFPDARVLQPLLMQCRLFAEETGMRWLGGLAYGGGAIIDGAPMEDLGKKGARITRGFEIALQDITRGQMISACSQDLLTIKIPAFLLQPLAAFLNHRARKTARINGVDLLARPFLESHR